MTLASTTSWSVRGSTVAEFGVDGLDELMQALARAAGLPVEAQDQILNAQADVVADAMKQEAMRLADTGALARSIRKKRPSTRKGVRQLSITFSGSRKRGGTTTRNAEIAFVNEFGAPKKKLPAKQWIRSALEKSESRTTEAGAAALDEYLKSNDL